MYHINELEHTTYKMSGLGQFRTQQIENQYHILSDYKEYVDKGTDEAFRILCEAEAERDLLAAYAYTSEDAYNEWVEADKLATKAKETYNEWLKEQREVHEEYYEVIDKVGRYMFANNERW